MNDLRQLTKLIKKRNALECEITALIGRPAAIGHIGEYIASRVFHIALEESASCKSIDGHFEDGPLKYRTVNVKWYARQESILNITPDSLPDYYLVLAGPKSGATTSRGRVRPWVIENVFLFDAQPLVEELKCSSVKIGLATSVRQQLWTKAEIYPV
ncbi:MAG: hypothetical protein JXB07_14895 [Anaerolineae bacterium]|nr:hypothetical protein [Anaerolineae bacterium]